MKTLFITPHLSTGGLPQYLVQQVEKKLADGEEVWIVEWNNIAPVYRVQKDKLKELLQDRLVDWPQGTGESVKIAGAVSCIKTVAPDVVHLEEFPEGFLPKELINWIYDRVISYRIIETTHDSAFLLSKKSTRPDKFEFVSSFHKELFKDFGVYIEVVPYEYVGKDRFVKEDLLKELTLDPECKHVLNVGLFTPGKNQGAAMEVARKMLDEKVVFHFVGNQAGNFADYWQPLMEKLPPNCVIWGERQDVEKFYSCMDLLLFTSKSELMPLVPIEALGYGMPVLMYKDEKYSERFDNKVEWLGSTLDIQYRQVCESLGFRKKKTIKLVHLLTRPEDEREKNSIDCLSRLAAYGIEYVQKVNTPCEYYPTEFPALQVHKDKKPGYYGAYRAFREGITEEFTTSVDLLIVCECDCILSVEPEQFVDLVYKAIEEDFDYGSFGQNLWSEKVEDIGKEFYYTDKIILAHCVLFKRKSRDFLINEFIGLPWDSPDLWLDFCFNGKKKMVLHNPIAFQHEGFSLIDLEEKKGEYRISDKKEGQEIDGNFDSEPLYRYVVETLDGGHLVEIGAWKGKSTAFLAKLIKDSGKDFNLDVVDTFKGSKSEGYDGEESVFEEFVRNLTRLDLMEYLVAHVMESTQAAEMYSDESLDFVFIDADHSYESVREDIECWYPKVKKGGIIAGHDYIDIFPGVEEAVREMFDTRYEVKHTTWYHFKEIDQKGDVLLEEYVESKDIKCEVSFYGAPRVNISGSTRLDYTIDFIDQDEDRVVYSTVLKPQHWAQVARRYYTNWRIEVKQVDELVYSESLELGDKRVLINFGSKSLGDTLAWIPYLEVFAKKHSCRIVASTFWNNLYRDEYPEIEFVEPGSIVKEIYAAYDLGCFDDGEGTGNKKDWRTTPMQQIATDILGLEYKELRPRITVPKLEKTQEKAYVSMSEYSTMQCKFWNLADGWDKLVDSIRSMGLQVMSVSKEKTQLKRVRRCNNKSIDETIRNIYYSKAFIGVGSGLSWLAWGLGVPVVLISGFSEKYCEFMESETVSRLINESVCHGCFNDVEWYFDRGDWNWCPREEAFVCSKSISVNQVLEGLRKVLK